MQRAAITCGPDTTAAEIAQLMSREGIGSVVVVSDGLPAGIVTDRDLRRKIVGEGRDSRTTPASALMSSPVISLSPDAFVLDALVVMTRRGIHHLVVAAEGRLVGVISSSDVLRLDLPHPVAVSREIAAASSLDAQGSDPGAPPPQTGRSKSGPSGLVGSTVAAPSASTPGSARRRSISCW